MYSIVNINNHFSKGKQTMSKRITALLIALLMLAPTLISCSETNDVEENKKESEATIGNESESIEEAVEIVDENLDENGYLKDDLPEDLNYGGSTINVLYWSDVENQEFEADEFTGEIVNDAIYQRNLNVEDGLGVKFNWVGTPGNNGNTDSYVSKVRGSVTAGDNAYDILAAYSRSIMASVVNGLTADLSQLEYIDFEKPWWPDNLISEAMINDRLYLASGDISTNMLHMMYCVYYNRQMIEDYNLENPTDLVFAGTWTLDKLVEMTTDMYVDLNGNGSEDVSDQYGFTITNYHNDAFYTGSYLKLVEQDEEKKLKISDDFYSEKAVSVIEKLGPWENSADVYLAGDYETPFTEGRALFNINRAHYASKALRDSEVSYGIVPVPKYNEEQESYRTVMGNPVTLYGVTINCDKKEMAGAVLESLASNAYRLTTPAIFENNMKAKYSDDDINAQMYDIVRGTVSFDLGRFLNKYLSNITDIFFGALVSNNNSWASTSAKYKKALDKTLGRLVDGIIENEANLDG